MAEILRSQTTDELAAKIGAKLDILVTASSTPSTSQVVTWMNDAALLLARFLPDHRLGKLKVEVSEESVGEYLTVDEPWARVVTAKKFGVVCRRLKQRDMDLVTTRTPLLFTSRNPAYCNSGGDGDVQLQFWPATPGPVTIKAIRKPQAYEATGWVPGDYTLPPELELLAIDYTVIQAKVQDEEPEQTALLMQAWEKQAGLEGAIGGLGV